MCCAGTAEEYPRNLTELEANFGIEEACRAYLTLRWPAGFPLSPLRIREGMAGAGSVGVCRVWVPDLSGCRNDLFQDTRTPVTRVVSRHVVGDDPEERRQRVGTATSAGG